MYRLLAIGVVLLWISAMAALFVRDVWPAWIAQTPPPMTVEQFALLQPWEEQFGLSTADGARIGTAWNRIETAGGGMTLRGTLLLDGVRLIPTVLVETVTGFDGQGQLDHFRLSVHGVPMTKIHVEGERRGIYFPCQLQVGPMFRETNLDLSASRMIGESLRPFSVLPALEVGQSWRMQMLDPVSAVLAGKTHFTALVARVTGRETLHHHGRPVECFVVETSPQEARAWVDSSGRVLLQKVEMPGLGMVTVQEEPFEPARLAAANERVLRSGRDTE